MARVHFIIVPGNKNGLREERADYETVIDPIARNWRVHNIVLPVLTLVPSFAGYSLLSSRESASAMLREAGHRIYPLNYEPGLPISHHPSEVLDEAQYEKDEIGILRSPVQGLRFVERWLAPRLMGRQLITITLRDYAFMSARNSNLEAWGTFAHRLDPTKFLPVFILDTERTLDAIPPILSGFEIFKEASWNVGLRMAFYESSYLSLGINNGPIFMAVLNSKTRILIFKILTSCVPQTTEEMMSKLGFEIGGQLPFASQFQKLVWKDDDLETIEHEFHTMVAKIENI